MIGFLRHAKGTGQAPDAPLADASAAALTPGGRALGGAIGQRAPDARARQIAAPFAAAADPPTGADARRRSRAPGAIPADGWGLAAARRVAPPSARPFGGDTRCARTAPGAATARAPGTRFVIHRQRLRVLLGRCRRPVSAPLCRAMPRTAAFSAVGAKIQEVGV
ncbi:MAG: hypothetical protein AAF281_14390 [Pseudomonadota bacterium]